MVGDLNYRSVSSTWSEAFAAGLVFDVVQRQERGQRMMVANF
jgi:hypothetical protein